MPPPAPIIRLLNVTRRHGPVTALDNVSLDVSPGERVAILGKSGSGKSSLLHLLAGLDRPTSGVVEVRGRDLSRMDSASLADHRLHTVGIVFQSFHLIGSRSAAENVQMPLIFAGVPPAIRRRRIAEALAAVGLVSRSAHRPAELSGGEAQRVAIARALINDPPLILADEPTGNLDSTTASAIMGLILDHVTRRGATLVLVTHDEELARRHTSRIVQMRDGHIEEG